MTDDTRETGTPAEDPPDRTAGGAGRGLPPDLAGDTPPPVAGAPTSGVAPEAWTEDPAAGAPAQSSAENDERRANVRRQGP
jgi:hypothetical protein